MAAILLLIVLGTLVIWTGFYHLGKALVVTTDSFLNLFRRKAL